MDISYRESKGKIVICKDGVYMALSYGQIKEMWWLMIKLALIYSMKKITGKVIG